MIVARCLVNSCMVVMSSRSGVCKRRDDRAPRSEPLLVSLPALHRVRAQRGRPCHVLIEIVMMSVQQE